MDVLLAYFAPIPVNGIADVDSIDYIVQYVYEVA